MPQVCAARFLKCQSRTRKIGYFLIRLRLMEAQPIEF